MKIEHESNPDTDTGEIYKFQTWYWHLDEVYVNLGQEVKQGQPIGTSGNTGHVRGRELDANISVQYQENSAV